MLVNDAGEPTNDFGIGGQVTAVPVEAPAGTATPAIVVSASSDSFVATNGLGTIPPGAYTYRFGAGDTATINGLALTPTQLASQLNAGDQINVIYDPAAPDTFTYVTDIPGVPSAASAAFVDTTGNGVNDTVRVSWTNPNSIALVQNGYVIERASVAADGTVGTFGTPAAITAGGTGYATANAALTADLTPPTVAADYVYRVRVTGFNGGVNLAPWSNTTNAVNIPAAQPAIVTTLVPASLGITDADADTALGSGDTVTFTLNASVAAATSASLTLVNSVGQSTTLTRGAGSTWTVTGTAIAVALTAAPTVSNGQPFDLAGNQQVSAVTGVTGAANAALVPNLRFDGDDRATAATTAPAITSATASSTANTVTAVGVATGAFVRVYDNTGTTLLATSPTNVGATPNITFAVPGGLAAGQNIQVVHSLVAETLIESDPVFATAS